MTQPGGKIGAKTGMAASLRYVRPILIVAVLSLTIIVLAPMQALAVRRNWRLAGYVPVLFHRLVMRLTGTRVDMRGVPPDGHPVFIVANHVSWFDIPVLGSLRPLSFIAKSEVSSWPGVGFLARMQRTVFIDRARRSDTAAVNRTVAKRIAGGDAMVLFAEGTTGDGTRILPFRSSLIGAVQAVVDDYSAGHIRLQPLAIRYMRRNGLPVSRRERPQIAWYGNMDLAGHLIDLLCNGPLDVRVVWGESIPFDAMADRKSMARRAEESVRQALLAS